MKNIKNNLAKVVSYSLGKCYILFKKGKISWVNPIEGTSSVNVYSLLQQGKGYETSVKTHTSNNLRHVYAEFTGYNLIEATRVNDVVGIDYFAQKIAGQWDFRLKRRLKIC